MDPDKCFALLLDAIAEREPDDIREHAENLAEWIARGGFAPDIREHLELISTN